MHLLRYFFVIIFIAVILYIPVNAQGGTIKGRVFNSSSNEPVAFASLVIAGTNISTLSDSMGNFVFSGIKPGYYKIAARTVGFEDAYTEEFHVTNANHPSVNIAMIEKPFEIDQVVVKANAFKKVEESPVSLKSIGISEIEKSPGGNRDISKIIQALPGVSSGVAYRNDLVVRGGGPSENRFLVDGIEIPNLNHFGTQGASGGSVGIINSDFLREADLYTGAFSANRGNVLSSVLDMKLIDGNDEMVYRAALGASEISLSAAGPISENTSILLSLRRSYLQLLFSALKLPFLPTFNDYTLKLKTRFNNKNELTFLSIGSLDKSVLNTDIKDPDEEQQYILSYLPSYDQWTYAIGAVYRHYRQNSYDTWVLSRNMLDNGSDKFENNDENADRILRYNSQEIENKFRYENTTRIKGYKFITGISLEQAKYNNSTFRKVFIPVAQDTITSLNYSSSLNLIKYGAFFQVSRPLFSDKLTLSSGFRMDGNSYSPEMWNPLRQISPRLSVSYNISSNFTLNANTGIYYQHPSYTTLAFRDNEDRLVNKSNKIKYIRSDHIVAGLEYRRTRESRLSVEGFYKIYENYPFSLNDSVSLASKGADYGVYGDEPVTPASEGRAYGAELYFRDKLSDQLNVILSYTLVRSEFKDNDGKLIPSAWDNRHILNLSFFASFGKNWSIGGKWRFVGGAPYTPYDINRSSLIEAWDAKGQGYPDFSRYNSERLESFHQLDVRIDKEFFFMKWSLGAYIDIQNLYNFKSKQPEVLVAQRDENGVPLTDPNDPSRYLLKYIPSESGTILPSIGIVVEF